MRVLLIVFASLICGKVEAAPVTYTLPQETVAFRDGPGRDAAAANCQICHSPDYIATQPPRMGLRFWTAEVTKMIKVYGAPISEADAATIANYLASTY